MRCLCLAVSLTLVAVAFSAPDGALHAAEPPAATAAKAVVWIEPIGDSGGAGEKMEDGETLARRFTRGLRAALEGEAKARFAVRIAPRALPSAEPPTLRFVLRGGLSRIQDTSTPGLAENRPYLCIVRLFQESAPAADGKIARRLIGQWAASARGLRDLTGNLTRDPRVHVLGLAGELSRRVTQTTLKKIDPAATVSSPAPPSHAETDSPPAVLVLEGE